MPVILHLQNRPLDWLGRRRLRGVGNFRKPNIFPTFLDFLEEGNLLGPRLVLVEPANALDLMIKECFSSQNGWHRNVGQICELILGYLFKHVIEILLRRLPVHRFLSNLHSSISTIHSSNIMVHLVVHLPTHPMSLENSIDLLLICRVLAINFSQTRQGVRIPSIGNGSINLDITQAIHNLCQGFRDFLLDVSHFLIRHVVDANRILVVGIVRLTDELDVFTRMCCTGIVANTNNLEE